MNNFEPFPKKVLPNMIKYTTIYSKMSLLVVTKCFRMLQCQILALHFQEVHMRKTFFISLRVNNYLSVFLVIALGACGGYVAHLPTITKYSGRDYKSLAPYQNR